MPATNSPIIGHRENIDFLCHAKERGRLAHAYLFVGPERIGKRAVARHFGAELLATSPGDIDHHPDFFLLERERDKKTVKLHGSIVIEQVLALVGRLARTSFMRGWKICVLDGADRLQEAAANALLKSLEEPAGRTLLVLLAESADGVLATLRSRCQILTFRPVAAETIAGALIAVDGIPPAQAEIYARLSGGRPGVALELARDSAAFRALRERREGVLRFLAGGVPERWEEAAKLLPAKLPFREAGDRVEELLDLAAELLRDALHISLGRSEDVQHADIADRLRDLAATCPGPAGLRIALENLAAARQLVRENVSPRAALEKWGVGF